jgi:acyl carrier protein
MTPMTTGVAEKVIAILAEQALVQPSDVKMEHSLDDLGIDSMGVVEVIFGVEEAFGIDVPFNANSSENPDFDISSVATIVAAVETLVARQGA